MTNKKHYLAPNITVVVLETNFSMLNISGLSEEDTNVKAVFTDDYEEADASEAY